MILVIGGSYQGKLEFILKKYGFCMEDVYNCNVNGNDVYSIESCYTAKVIYHYHELINKILEYQKDPLEITKDIFEKNPKVIIISNEIGYGIVPTEKFQRDYRENVGRVCCYIAEHSDTVIRVTAGIGKVIKG